MSFSGSLFGKKAASSGQSTVKSQIPQVEEILKGRIVSFSGSDKAALHPDLSGHAQGGGEALRR